MIVMIDLIIKNLNYCEASSGECIPAGFSNKGKTCGYEVQYGCNKD